MTVVRAPAVRRSRVRISVRAVVELERFADMGAQRSGVVRRPARVRLTGWVALVAAAQLGVLLATSTRYGYHRDELYFIVAGSHPALGYPDQPALVPLLSQAM